MRSKWIRLTGLLLSLTALTSCALAPEEERVQTAPLIRAYEQEVFQLKPVERGDLVQIGSVDCKYVAVQTATLSFALGGEYVDRMMVKVGDSVIKGQLLGQLQLGNLEEQMAAAQSALEELALRRDHLNRLYELERRRGEVAAKSLDAAAQKEAAEELEKDFAARFQEIEDAQQLQTLTMEALQREIDERQIRAPFDGTITYVCKFDEGDMSVFGYRVVTLADSTLSLFRAETQYWDRFTPGDVYDIKVGDELYAAQVKSEEDLGVEPSKKEAGKKAYVYFALLEPSFELEDGDRGRIEIVLEERLDALYVPRDAVSSANGQAIVYVLREDGMRAYREVETGITVDKRTEILSGLSEGESVIVD